MTQYDKISNVMNYLERVDLESTTGIQLSTWCSNQITWSYKWKKITHDEMIELTNRITKLLEEQYEILDRGSI